MSLRLLARGAAIAMAAAGMTSCQDPSAIVAEGDVLDSPDLRAVAGDPHPSQLALARAIPGFGGYYVDEQGRPTVWLQDAGRRAVAERALARALIARGLGAGDLQVREGKYRYADLDQWYRRLRRIAFGLDGVVLGDVDERANRIRFGVTSPIAAEMLKVLLSNHPVPGNAIVVETRRGYRTLATLRDRVRPLGGGLQINFFATPATLRGPSLLCTLGFNAEVDGVRSFITNSHCTNVEGGVVAATEYYQALRTGGVNDRIGLEADDPDWSFLLADGCTPPLQCRYSDAARVAYDAGVEAPLGVLARIDAPSTSLADTIHDIVGQYQIVAERGDPVVGEVVNKVGRTTGWTLGPVTATCVDVLALGTTHMRLCQSVVSALVDGGDSGSPVFADDPSGSGVVLLGILWGGSVDEEAPEFVFSPMSGIERELGALRTF